MGRLIVLLAATWLLIAGLANTLAAKPEQTGRFLDTQTRLASALIQRLANEPTKNTSISPASLAASLAFIDPVADDAMHAALIQTLGFAPPLARQSGDAFQAFRRAIIGLNKNSKVPNVTLKLPSLLVIDKRLPVSPAALGRLRATGAQLSVEDLSSADTLKSINIWVGKQTQGLIASIIDIPLSEPTMVSLNALYFKGIWEVQFDKELTKPMPFQDADGNTSEVVMMHADRKMLFRADGRFAAVDLPYRSNRFSIVLITTIDSPTNAAGFEQVESWLGGDGFIDADVHLSLPKFTVRDGADLLPALDGMGLRSGSDSPTAFRALSSQPLHISAIVQRTYMRLDEEGTEAAAATASRVMEVASLVSRQRAIIVVDKPFLFALRDRLTGLILLSGYIARPTNDGGQ